MTTPRQSDFDSAGHVAAGPEEAAADSSDEEVAPRGAGRRDGEGEPHSITTILLDCLFAMVFAAATLSILNCFGLVKRSGTRCPVDNGYAKCEIWQDVRAMLSFLLGACLCCLLASDRKTHAEGPSKVQLYTACFDEAGSASAWGAPACSGEAGGVGVGATAAPPRPRGECCGLAIKLFSAAARVPGIGSGTRAACPALHML
eukprot:CAMPEP_0179341458 /NCGR_PEP_ID=MMETSP0797-20121207/69846_1 /TAXON_ID=47934 /ORGANISM="Dinophysis acuminata, Strain DAEP01" /LENGTH=201 /DNA_ID=CAMNT_0021055531 /DNA_START=94 /DNA_END=697 /DNA_ORIENTATION=-